MDNLNKFPLEFVKPFAFCFKLLNKINITFFDNKPIGYKRNWKFYCEIPFVLLHNISILVNLIQMFQNGSSPLDLAKAIPVYFIFMDAILKAAITLWKRTEIEKLVTDLGKRWRTSNLTQQQEQKRNSSMKKLQWCLKFFFYFTMTASTQNIIGPICYMFIGRLFFGKDLELVLPFECAYPYDPFGNWFIYLGTYAYQAVIMYGMVYGFIGCECMMITFCVCLVSEFAMLREDLILITPVDRNNLNDESTPDIISSDGRMADQLDSIYNIIVMIDMMSVIISMCFFGFASSIAYGMIETAINAVGVLVTLFPVFLFCFFGETLKEESSGIADSAYESLWYKGDARYQKMILLIIVRSQRPCCLTLLKHSPVSLNMFTKVLSSTWSYFSLVRSVYSET